MVRKSHSPVYSVLMKSRARYLLLTIVAALVVAGCNGDTVEGTTTTLGEVTTTSIGSIQPAGGVTSSTVLPTTSSTSTTTSSTAPPPPLEPQWSIVERIEGEDGATVTVLLDPESYERLTDIDLQNIIEDVIEMFPPIYEVHLVDSEEAAAVVLSDVIDTNDQAILGDHYFVRLEEGFRLVFVGPFSDFGITILGS